MFLNENLPLFLFIYFINRKYILGKTPQFFYMLNFKVLAILFNMVECRSKFFIFNLDSFENRSEKSLWFYNFFQIYQYTCIMFKMKPVDFRFQIKYIKILRLLLVKWKLFTLWWLRWQKSNTPSEFFHFVLQFFSIKFILKTFINIIYPKFLFITHFIIRPFIN